MWIAFNIALVALLERGSSGAAKQGSEFLSSKPSYIEAGVCLSKMTWVKKKSARLYTIHMLPKRNALGSCFLTTWSARSLLDSA